ncbi:MAG: hypothetical protein GY858_02360 [Candidatus Omnitrophica bacterium]|nr:hypothetical protein [Candidatus Omnitrophota bacterium]
MLGKFSSLKLVNSRKVVIIVFALLLAVMVIYFPNFAKLHSLRQANNDLRRDINVLEEEIEELREKIINVNSDPLVYERIAREELGAARQDEIVIDIKE